MNNIEFLLSFYVITNFAFIVFAICRDIYSIKYKENYKKLIDNNSRLIEDCNSYILHVNARIDKIESLMSKETK